MKYSNTVMMIVCTGFVLSLGCATALRAAETGESDEIKLPNLRLSAFADETPYAGYGEVFILDDATLLVSLREMVTEDGADESVPGEELDRMFYDLDATGLSLVEYGDRVFLDRNGTHLRRLGLTAEQVNAVPFDGAGRAPSTNGNVILDSFSGDLNLRWDRRSNSLFVSVLDDETARLFAVTLVGTSRPADANADAAARGDPPDPQPPMQSHCSVENCQSGGSGSITCVGKGCTCVCIHRDPVCGCTTRAAVGG